MNIRLKNLAGLFKDTRTRTIIIFTGLVIIFAIVVGIVRMNKAPQGPGSSAEVQGAPNIQSIPGGFDKPTTAEYARLQEQQNELQAKIAAQQGTSAIPTIIKASSFDQQDKANVAGSSCCNPCPCPGSTSKGIPPLQPSALTPGTLIYDAQGKVIGTVGADGKVRDSSGRILGTVGPDGLVRDSNGNVIGSAAAVSAGTAAYNSQGKLLGTIGADGKVRDAQGNIVGTVDADGTIRDLNGNVVGQAGAVSQGTPVYDAQGTLIGSVGPDGKVRDAQGKIIGTVGIDGAVRNAQGKLIGKASSTVEGTPVYDAQGRLIGMVGADGKVRNAEGRVIGSLGADGIVRDVNGKMIGNIGSARGKGGVPGAAVYDSQGRLIGIVGADGKVRDITGKVIGTVGADGTVRDANGNIIGKASSVVPGSPVYDAEGRLIGTVGTDGKVRDANGKIIGTVGVDGVVRDVDGNIIGKVGLTAPGTPIYDAQGRLIGTAGPDGIVRDSSGRAIGTLGADGSVRDVGGQIIGSTRNAAAGDVSIGGAAAQPATTSIPSIQGQNSDLQAILERQATQVSQQQAEQIKAQMQSAIASQANQLLASWVSPMQQYVEGSANKEAIARAGANGNGSATAAAGPPAVKAGTIMYGVLSTAVNSDEPGPILATIVDGRFKGGKLIGTLTYQGQKVLLSFNTLNLPNVSKTIAVSVVAIDPNTARTAFSSYTDNHYLMRYGSLFAASFLQGYGQAYQTSGQTVITNGLQTQTANPNLGPTGKFYVALGNVGQRFSSVLEGVFNTPPTVYVNSGSAMGMLFLADVPPLPA